MKFEHFIGALVAIGLIALFSIAHFAGRDMGKLDLVYSCARDGFFWHYGDRWSCAKTTPK